MEDGSAFQRKDIRTPAAARMDLRTWCWAKPDTVDRSRVRCTERRSLGESDSETERMGGAPRGWGLLVHGHRV